MAGPDLQAPDSDPAVWPLITAPPAGQSGLTDEMGGVNGGSSLPQADPLAQRIESRDNVIAACCES